MTNKLTAEKLKIMIYSMSRPNGGYEKLINDHVDDLAKLLENFVLPELEKAEQLQAVLSKHNKYLDEEYDSEEEYLWDGMGD